MEGKFRWLLLAAVAPITWGTSYFVNGHFMPGTHPLWGSALRALPAGLILLILCRQLPRGAWIWRSAVLGLLNIGGFFVLIFLSAQLLPSSVASSIMALSPVVLMVFAWPILGQRPSRPLVLGAFAGVLGVPLLVGIGGAQFNPWGVLASGVAMLLSSLGYVLARRWQGDVPVLQLTCWQLLWGGGALLVVALVFEGPPPALGPAQWAAVGYLSVIATALAYICWFGALAKLEAGVVGVIGLLNPVAGVSVGLLIGKEYLAPTQWLGLAIVLFGMGLVQLRPARRQELQSNE